MRLFRNPEESSDSELIEYDLDVINAIGVEANFFRNFLDNHRFAANFSEDGSDDSDVDYESYIDSCPSSDYLGMSSDSDDEMSDNNTDSRVFNMETRKSSSKNPATATAKNATTNQPAESKTDGNDDDASEAKTSTVHFNEDDESDETVRAIIAAIKKPRSNPPEIKTEDFITDICFHCERDIIAVATITGDVCLYEYSNEGNKLLRTIEVHAKACRDVEFSADGCNLLTCSKDRSIMITDMETEKLKKFFENAHDESINKLHVIDANIFATGDDNGTVKLWDLRMKNEIFGLKEVEDYISDMLTNDTGKLLLVTSGDGYLTTLNIGARKLYVQSEPYGEELTCMNTYRNDSKVVVGSSQGNLYTFNWGQFGYHSDKYPGVKTPISKMIPITDRIACVAGEEGVIRAVHVAPFRNLGIVGQHDMPIESLDINSTGELIASSSHSNDVRFWNVKYFEDFVDIKYNEKHKPYREKRHHLPSSKFSNASDFFSDLNKTD